ncbi:META domain-containing protein [Chloroflexota bacterium]
MKIRMIITFSALLILLISASCQGTATPTEEVLEPTQMPTVEPSSTPEPTAISAEEPTATAAPTEIPVIELVPQEAILNITWQWADWLQNSPEAFAVIADPENYTLSFYADNTFQFQADCNQGSGIYATSGLSMTLTLGATTAAECAAESLSDLYLGFLAQVSSFGIQGDKLILQLANNYGQMSFINSGAVAAPEQPEATACDAGIDPDNVTIDTLNLPHEIVQINCVPGTPYDTTQPFGPTGLPDHIQVNFDVTDPSDKQPGDPVIYIIPIEAYQELWEQSGDLSVTETYSQVLSLLQARPDPIPTHGMPILPFEEVAGTNDLVTQYTYFYPIFGFGVRIVGRFAQSISPVTYDSPPLYYIFQGVSDDGLYLISFFYPIVTFELPSSEELTDEETQQAIEDPRGYLDAKAEGLDELGYADWLPALSELDAVITSLEFPRPFDGPALTDVLWAWNELIEPDGQSLIINPDNYTLKFFPDGSLNVVADCNTGSGTYTLDDAAMTIQVGVMSQASCGEDSLHDQYLQYLNQVVGYELADGYLSLILAEEAGRLGFYIGSPITENPELPEDAPTAEAIDTVNVRSGPSTDYPSYGLASAGDRAIILGVSEDGLWWVVELPTYVAPDGRGWISAGYVIATNADDMPVIETPPIP